MCSHLFQNSWLSKSGNTSCFKLTTRLWDAKWMHWRKRLSNWKKRFYTYSVLVWIIKLMRMLETERCLLSSWESPHQLFADFTPDHQSPGAEEQQPETGQEHGGGYGQIWTAAVPENWLGKPDGNNWCGVEFFVIAKFRCNQIISRVFYRCLSCISSDEFQPWEVQAGEHSVPADQTDRLSAGEGWKSTQEKKRGQCLLKLARLTRVQVKLTVQNFDHLHVKLCLLLSICICICVLGAFMTV